MVGRFKSPPGVERRRCPDTGDLRRLIPSQALLAPGVGRQRFGEILRRLFIDLLRADQLLMGPTSIWVANICLSLVQYEGRACARTVLASGQLRLLVCLVAPPSQRRPATWRPLAKDKGAAWAGPPRGGAQAACCDRSLGRPGASALLWQQPRETPGATVAVGAADRVLL